MWQPLVHLAVMLGVADRVKPLKGEPHMKRLTILALGVGLALLLHGRAFAWVEERVLRDGQTEWRDFWPPGLRELAAGPGRVHGRHMIAHSFGKGHERWAFYFRGDPEAFHRFITHYAALRQGEFSTDTPLTLVLHLGKGEVQPLMGTMGDKPVASPDFDWLLSVSASDIRTDHPQVRVALGVWISSSLPLHQVKVPREIQVTTPFEAFVRQHEERRLKNNVTALQQRVVELRRELEKAQQQLEEATAGAAKGTDTAKIPPGATDEFADFWPTDQIVENWIALLAGVEARQYGLTNQQATKWERMNVQRWKPFLQELRLAWLLVRQFVEARFGPHPPDAELVKRWAKHARPVFDLMRDQLSAAHAELKAMLKPEQEARFEDNSRELNGFIEHIDRALGRWEQGELQEREWWESDPDHRERKRRRWTRSIREFELAGKSPPPSRPDGATSRPDGATPRDRPDTQPEGKARPPGEPLSPRVHPSGATRSRSR